MTSNPYQFRLNKLGPISSSADAELKNAASKLPRQTKTAPSFNKDDPSNIEDFFDLSEKAMDAAGITSDEAKIRQVLQ